MKRITVILGLFLLAGGTLAACSSADEDPAPADKAAATDLPLVTVYKSPTCGCCTKWMAHLEENGFAVEAVNVDDVVAVKQRHGVPANLSSCHTAVVGDYVVEGHVPADLVRRILRERPAAVAGLGVAGMPIGSPGMEGPNPQSYEVVAFGPRGQRVFSYQ